MTETPCPEKYYDTCKACNQKVMACKCNKTYEELESEWMFQQHEIAGLRMKAEAWDNVGLVDRQLSKYFNGDGHNDSSLFTKNIKSGYYLTFGGIKNSYDHYYSNKDMVIHNNILYAIVKLAEIIPVKKKLESQ